MSKSVTLSFGEPEPPAAPPRPFNPASMTRDERTSAGWQTLFVGWVIGLPSIMAVAFVGLVGLWYAWQFTNDLQTWLALSAGLIAITLFSAGMPIAWSLNRETQPVAAKAAAAFGLACIAMNFAIMTHFARHEPEALAPSTAIARDMPGEEARELDLEIDWRRAALANFNEDLEPGAPERTRREASTLEAQGWRAQMAGELRNLETKRYGAAVTAAPSRPESKRGLDLAGVALLMIIGSAVGLAISASSLAAILTEKAASVRLEAPEPEPAQASAIAAHHPAESADGFDHWAISSVSKLSGGRMRTTDAYENYTTFCARNDYARPLPVGEFGRRLRGWLAATYQIDGRHSNGTTYDNCTLKSAGHTLAAPAMNGGA